MKLREDEPVSGYVTCATCHDMHNINNVSDAASSYNYVVYSRRAESSLCRSCHLL